MPVSTPVILVTSVLSMVWHWNDYFEPERLPLDAGQADHQPQLPILMFASIRSCRRSCRRTRVRTCRSFSLQLQALFIREVSLEAVLMAAATMSVIPPLIVFASCSGGSCRASRRRG